MQKYPEADKITDMLKDIKRVLIMQTDNPMGIH
jgi:hypothetical protein